MRPVPSLVTALMMLAWAAPAGAIPRFAARTGNDCIQCHVNPGGGGPRNAYGRNIFERASLPMFSRSSAVPELTLDLTDEELQALEEGAGPSDDQGLVNFSGDVTDWLAIGADLRVSYMWVRPDHGLLPGTDPVITSDFFVMEDYLYLDARVHENVEMVLQIGPYLGFEAWGLFRLFPEDTQGFNLLVKAGHFYPTFGIREVEHQLFTREFIGIGNADRDTGVEVSAYAGPVTATVAILNGTLGGLVLDSNGTASRTFEKAVVARVSARADLTWGRFQLGGSFYFNENAGQANPLFVRSLPSATAPLASQGLNELRFGGFASANIGPATWLGDLVIVRDRFYSNQLSPITGYASYQELSWTVLQGLDLLSTLEYMDPDVELSNNSGLRAGFAVEFFPWPFVEMRAMVRRQISDTSPTGGTWDIVLFTHLFM